MSRIILGLMLAAIGALGATAVGGDDSSAYLVGQAGARRLKEPLILREEQGGFAGVTGTSRTVEPDGKWRLEEFRVIDGKEDVTSTKTGRLSQAELAKLASDLASHDLLGLAENIGEAESVNAHKVIFQFGKKRSTITGVAPRLQGDETTKSLIAKTAADRGLSEDKQFKRCAELAHAIETRVGPAKD